MFLIVSYKNSLNITLLMFIYLQDYLNLFLNLYLSIIICPSSNLKMVTKLRFFQIP